MYLNVFTEVTVIIPNGSHPNMQSMCHAHRGLLLNPEEEGGPDTRTARMDLSPRCSGRGADTQGHTDWDLFTGNDQNRQMHRQTWTHGCWAGKGGETCS